MRLWKAQVDDAADTITAYGAPFTWAQEVRYLGSRVQYHQGSFDGSIAPRIFAFLGCLCAVVIQRDGESPVGGYVARYQERMRLGRLEGEIEFGYYHYEPRLPTAGAKETGEEQ